jgi:hypothetical protein
MGRDVGSVKSKGKAKREEKKGKKGEKNRGKRLPRTNQSVRFSHVFKKGLSLGTHYNKETRLSTVETLSFSVAFIPQQAQADIVPYSVFSLGRQFLSTNLFWIFCRVASSGTWAHISSITSIIAASYKEKLFLKIANLPLRSYSITHSMFDKDANLGQYLQ